MRPGIIGWGSSSMALIGPAMEVALAPWGVGFLNEGRGGETSHHTAARLGSIPLPVSIEGGRLPAAGTVRLLPTALDLVPHALKPFAGHVAGIAAVVHGTTEGIFLTRLRPGEPVAVDGDPFVPVTPAALHGRDALLWMGKNDLNRGQDAAGVIDRIVTSARFLAAAGARVAVVGQFTNNGADPAMREKVLEVNRSCAEHFGPAHLDVQDFLTSPALPAATGIDPTAEDLAERAAGAKPPSVSTDPGHFDQLGNAAVARHLLRGLQQLDGFDRLGPPASAPDLVATPSSVPAKETS